MFDQITIQEFMQLARVDYDELYGLTLAEIHTKIEEAIGDTNEIVEGAYLELDSFLSDLSYEKYWVPDRAPDQAELLDLIEGIYNLSVFVERSLQGANLPSSMADSFLDEFDALLKERLDPNEWWELWQES